MTNNIFEKLLAQLNTKPKTAKQEQIVEAAIQLFAAKGYANTSTAEIARVAGVSEGTIFKHYGTKERLLFSVIAPFIRELFPQLAREVVEETFTEDTRSLEQFLRTLIKNRIQFITENRELFQVFVKELMYREEFRKKLFPFAMEYVPKTFKHIVDRFKESGELRDDIPSETIILNVLTFLSGFLITRIILRGSDTISEKEMEEAVQFIMEGIRNSHKPEANE